MKVRVYVACSLDGFIAGPNDDLSWLPPATPKDVAGPGVGFDEFMPEIGALLMGRRTYDVVTGFGGEWPYGDRPVLVATHRPLEIATASVRPVAGEIGDLVQLARQAAGDKDVYVDGGVLIASALDAGLVDELIVTIVPVVLGEGHRLFPAVHTLHAFEFTAHHTYGDMVQLHLRPRGPLPVVLRWNDAINRRDLEALTALMTEDHLFVDTAGNETAGRDTMGVNWAKFFDSFPDYRNIVATTEVDGDRVRLTGRSECSDPALRGPAIWEATVRDDRIAAWRVKTSG